MNVPNTLTMSRLGLAAVMMALLTLDFHFSKSLALLVFAVAGFTDYLDGHIARRDNISTPFGKLMDPLTDKVMVCAAFVSFVGVQMPYGSAGKTHSLVPAWIAVVIISREFLVTGLRLLAATRGNIISAGKFGKHKTVWQIIAIIVILMGLSVRDDILLAYHASSKSVQNFNMAFSVIAYAVAAAVALVTVASGVLYFMQHRELMIKRNTFGESI